MFGTIKTMSAILGFGFIAGPDGIEYIFNRHNVARDERFESLL